MLIRKIQKKKKNQIYKKKRAKGPSWKPSSIFTYKYWSPQHTLGGGEQFYTFGRKHKKTLNLKFPPETKTSRAPHPWPLIFFLHTGHPLSLQKKTLNTPESFSSSSRSRRPRPSGSISQAAAPPLFWQRQTRAATTHTASPSSLISSLLNLKETHCQHRSLPLGGVFSSFDLHQRQAPPSHTTAAGPLHHQLGRHRPHLLSRSTHSLEPTQERMCHLLYSTERRMGQSLG